MSIDDQAFETLIEQSQDLHSDAMRHSDAILPDLADASADARAHDIDPEAVEHFDEARREHRDGLGLTAGGIAGTGLLAGGLGAILAGMLATPAGAAEATGFAKPLDIACLQTASGLEVLAVATYKAALALPFIANGNAVVVKFAQTTMMQHDEHRQAFQAQSKKLGGKVQKSPNPVGLALVQATTPKLMAPLDVVRLAATLEMIATNTYLNNMTLLSDTQTVTLFGTVQGVECQHLATLRAVAALLQGAPELIAIPVDASQLPSAAGSVAFPLAFEPTTLAANPEEGAL